MKSLISIIVPAYNIEKYIVRCLDSLTSQTYDYIEIIVVDDGSKDNTGPLIDQYALKDSRIKVIHQKNQGVSMARNTGLDIAKGEYIGFVDGDDTADIDMFEFLVDQIEENEADIAHCGYKMVYPSKAVYYHNTGTEIIQDGNEGVVDLLKGKIIEPGVCNKLYKKELFEEIKFDTSIRINEDLLINFKLFRKAQKAIFVDVTKYNYILRKNSAATSKSNIYKIMDSYKVAKMILEESEDVSEIYPYAYKAFISKLVYIVGLNPKKMTQDAVGFKSEVLLELKEIKKAALKTQFLDKRMRIKLRICTRYNRLYIIIKDLYSWLSGNRYKYEVR